MRTLIFVLACIGIGYGIANFQFVQRTSGMKNVIGPEEDMEAAILRAEQPRDKAPGRIEVLGGTDLDFGTMRQGTRRSHKFVFKNVGGSEVQLRFKSSTCKCTIGKFEEQILKPGDKTDVELEWLAEKGVEEFSQSATIVTNAIDQEEIKLTIHGEIGTAYVVDPVDFNLGDFQSNEETDITGRIYSFEEAPMAITSGGWLDSVTSKKVQVTVGEPVKLEKGQVPRYADARYMLDFRVKLLRGIPAGTFSGNVTFARKPANLGDPEEFVYFPIRGRAISVINVVAGNDYNEDRNIFNLGKGTSRTGLKKSFILRIKKGDAEAPTLKLARLIPATAQEHLKVTISEPTVSPTQTFFTVTLEVPPGTPEIDLDGTFAKDFAKIVLETNIESAPEFPMFIKFSIKD